MEEHNTSKIFHEDFYGTGKELYAKYGIELRALSERESTDYGACNFKLPGKTIEFRVSKVTPKKVGQFVAIWKRNEQGLTQPFEETDQIDFMVISSKTQHNFGLFVFPKSILIAQGVITSKKNDGKRGIRVYPPWDKPTNKQAQKSQSWQIKYFISVDPN
ncbi:MepB family protein [Pedobacter panaciterrae]|uniref:MepB family protein n=1 Tax=Pedobacter panaciterrae TaxID=363849 RepID=UPI0025996170|nr:MepB family protein [uncultured Pedobacter sp.]